MIALPVQWRSLGARLAAQWRRVVAAVQRDGRALAAIDYAELDLNSAGSWPAVVRRAAIALVFLISWLVGYGLLVAPQNERQASAVSAEAALLDRYARLAFQAANLTTYRDQMVALNASLAELLAQLPGDAEVPALLEEITLLANGSGLAVESLTLQDERQAAFYTELPIALKVTGGYHDFGNFVAGLAALPRIVTLHDFSVAAASDGSLTLTIAALTYRYQRAVDGEVVE